MPRARKAPEVRHDRCQAAWGHERAPLGMLAWRRTARRLDELRYVLDKAADRGLSPQRLGSVAGLRCALLRDPQVPLNLVAVLTGLLADVDCAAFLGTAAALSAVAKRAQRLAERARELAVAAESSRAHLEHAQIKAHFAEISRASASKLHAFTKPKLYVAAAPVAVQGERRPVSLAKAKLGFWARQWRVEDSALQNGPKPWIAVHLTQDDRDQCQPLSGSDLLQAGSAFKVNTALKLDALHPRVLRQTYADTLDVLADLLNRIELQHEWPGQVQGIVYVLIDKIGGGERPIGIFAGMVRLWERARLPQLREWQQRTLRDYDFARAGTTAEDAVWHQLLEAEALPDDQGPREMASITVLTDLVKCFERIRLAHVWAWGTYWGMPKILLRMILVTYSMPRRILTDGCFSEQVTTCAAIVPGSVFAIAVLHAMLMHPIDSLLSAWRPPGVRLLVAKYVDDVGLRALGPAALAAEALFSAFDTLVHIFESQLDLEVSLNRGDSRGKTRVIASGKWLYDHTQARWASRGVDVVPSVANLGVQHQGYGKVAAKGKTARAKRVAATRLRAPRLRYAKTKGARVHVVGLRALAPALQFGAAVTGTSPTMIGEMRRQVASTLPGSAGGKDRLLRLALFDADPAPRTVALPIVKWAAAVWERRADPRTMARAWRNQAQKVLGGGWDKSRGPASAIHLQLRMISWQWPRPDVMITVEGLHLDLNLTCPDDVRKMVIRDYQRAQWLEWRARHRADGLDFAPFVEPLQRWFRKKHGGPGASVAAQAVAGGLWTQARAHARLLADSNECQACASLGPSTRRWSWSDWCFRWPVGDALHRLTECPATRAHRTLHPAAKVVHRVATGPAGLWQRGLAQDPASRDRFAPSMEDTHMHVLAGPDGEAPQLSGIVASDGSRTGNWPTTGQVGWAVAAAPPGGGHIVVYGALPLRLPVQANIPRTELYALLQGLLHGVPAISLHVDCQSLLSGVDRGRDWCCAAARPNADLWREVWHKLDDMGFQAGHVALAKVKAHLTMAQKAGLDDAASCAVRANELADTYAKEGAKLGANASRAATALAQDCVAGDVAEALDFIAHMARSAAIDGGWKDSIRPPLRVGEVARRVTKVRPHLMQPTPFGPRCAHCFGSASAGRHCRKHPTSKLQSAGGASAAFADVNGHRLWRTGPYVWCVLCAKHTSTYVRQLAHPCPGRCKQKWWWDNLSEGLPPKTARATRAVAARVGHPRRLLLSEWRRLEDGLPDPPTCPPVAARRWCSAPVLAGAVSRRRPVFRLAQRPDAGRQVCLPWAPAPAPPGASLFDGLTLASLAAGARVV